LQEQIDKLQMRLAEMHDAFAKLISELIKAGVIKAE
jgi:hypothetical protein